jgi:hypothetical protein
LQRREHFITNTFALRPPQIDAKSNNILALCCPKKDLPADYRHHHLRVGFYVKPMYLSELERLSFELSQVKPNLIVALGNTALWALCGTSAIGTMRGTTLPASLEAIRGMKVLPTYHPSYLFQMPQHKVVVMADLLKAKREMEFPEIRRPQRFVTVMPSLQDIIDWYHTYAQFAPVLSCDIETAIGQITDIGFSTLRNRAITITLFNESANPPHTWSTLQEEVEVWRWIQKFLLLPAKKLFQNGIFDLQHIIKVGLKVRNCDEDTMLLHHSYYPEMQKSLGFLGSIYTDEPAWKLMNRRKKKEQLKKDE